MDISKLCDRMERREIEFHEFSRALRHREGPCTKDCPGRTAVCKRTCAKWAEHEALSQRIQKLKDKFGAEALVNTTHKLRQFKVGQL